MFTWIFLETKIDRRRRSSISIEIQERRLACATWQFSRLRVNRGKRNWADNIDCAALMFYWIRSLAALSSRVGTRPRKKSSRCRRCATDSFPSHGQKRAKRETTSLANRFHPRFYSPFFSSYVFHSIHIHLLVVEKYIRMEICPCKLSRWSV